MSELVDREVEAVEPAVVAGVEGEERAVRREDGGQREPRAALEGGGRIEVAYRESCDWIAASIAARLVAAFHWATTLPC